jgi:hypothetical protein
MRYTFTSKVPKVSAAASRDDSRPALTGAWLDTAAGEVRATDSYVAVRMPVEIDSGDADGWLSVDTLERSRKRDGGGVAANGSATVYSVRYGGGEPSPEEFDRLTVATFPRPDLGTPPNLPHLWPADDSGFTVGINAGFLKRAADAIGSTDGVVYLTFQSDAEGQPNPLRPIIVRTRGAALERTDGRSGLGRPEALVMPVRVS